MKKVFATLTVLAMLTFGSAALMAQEAAENKAREAEKAGREKAIEPGEPADLCRKDFVTYYRRLGREKFLEVLNFYPHADDKELKQHMKNLIAEKKNPLNP